VDCDGAMSVWKTFGAGSATYPTAWRRYEYDGLNVLRVDERCDNDLDGIIESNKITWRTVEVNTHKPGSLGALIGKRVFQYTNAADSTPNDPALDYTYTYDALGNVQAVFRASGNVGEMAHFFTQDAFGNELSNDTNLPNANKTNLFGSTTWATARAAGITEHQTGKWIDPFTGLYYFHARMYDPVVGRFVGRETSMYGLNGYNSPFHRLGDNLDDTFLSGNENHLFGESPNCCHINGGSIWRYVPPVFIISSVTFFAMSYFYCSIDCEALLEQLKKCVESRIKRPVTEVELAILRPYIPERFSQCQHASETLLKHIDPSPRDSDHILNPEWFQCPPNLKGIADDVIKIIIYGE